MKIYLDLLKKHLQLISSAISILMLIPILFIIMRIRQGMTLMEFDGAEPATLDKVLSYSIQNNNLLIPFIFLMIALIIQAIIASFFVAKGKTKQEIIFGRLTFIAGGLGINAIYWLAITLIKKNVLHEKKARSPIVSFVSILSAPLIIAAPLVTFAIYQGMDAPTNIKNVVYSTNPKYKNVIEIFTDGFDPNIILGRMKKNKAYNDFDIYPKMVVSGAETTFSFPVIMDGLDKRNIYRQYDDQKGKTSSMSEMSEVTFGETISKHLARTIKSVGSSSNKYLINAASVIENGTYAALMSGDPKFMNEIDDTIKVVNWGQTRKDLAGAIGTMRFSSDHAYYAWHNKKAVTDDLATEGTRLLLQDFSTHSPRIASSTGGVSFSTGKANGRDLTIEVAASGLDYSLTATINKLKSLRGKNGMSVYDNSMILIYGDHATHVTPLIHENNNINAMKYGSMLMVKYPKASYTNKKYNVVNSNSNVHNDREVYAPFINKIIANIDDPDFIKNNHNFKKDRVFLGFFGKEALYMKFDKNGILQRDLSVNKKYTTKGFISYEDYVKMDSVSAKRQKMLLVPVGWK